MNPNILYDRPPFPTQATSLSSTTFSLVHLLWLTDLFAGRTCQAHPSSGLLPSFSLCQSTSSTPISMPCFFFAPSDQKASFFIIYFY